MTPDLRARAAELPECIETWMEQTDVPGLSVAVVDSDQIVWAAGFGVAHAATQAPVTADTVFQAASLSKSAVAYAALRLADAGMLDLDQPLASYLPDPYAPDVPQVQAITARQLLSHSSGLQNWRHAPEDRLELALASGSGFRYSGSSVMAAPACLARSRHTCRLPGSNAAWCTRSVGLNAHFAIVSWCVSTR
jgi:CubicO group peptidase (beta-lactamase class C family)